MAEPGQLTRRHPLEARTAALAALPDAVRVEVEPFVTMVNVRLDAAAASSSGLPAAPNTWVPWNGGRAVWLGPDEWLVVDADRTPEEGSVTDVSAQRVALRLSGSRAREVLAKGCSIDLHPRVFGAGRSAQTTLGHAAVVLLALGDGGDDYAVLVRSSFAGYLADWLLDAAVEYA